MDEKVKTDEIKENTNQDSIEPKEMENHSVFTYLVDHPSISIATISAIVAISSFFINYISYMKQSQVLRLWNVDPTLVSIKNQQLFYSLCFSLVFFIISFISMSLISNTYMAYKPFAEYVVYAKTILSRYKENLKTNKHKLKTGELRIRRLPECDEKVSLSKENNALAKQIDELLTENKQIKCKVNKVRESFIRMLCANLSIALILTFVSSVFIVCSVDTKQASMNPIVSITILTIAQFFLYCLIGYSSMRLTIYKKKIFAQSEDKTIDFSLNNIKTKYPIAKIREQGFKSFFTNFTLFTMLINTIVLLVVYLSISAIPQNSAINEQKQFKVLSIGKTQYVVIYADTEKMVLEEATITDGSVTINTTKQRIVSVDAYPFEVITFEKATRANNNTSYGS